ncbi:alpha-glucoside transport system permease protein [Spinactinospora alkalitolerans]|uniref:Alpha-glucoside transport system permease protein n=1 Tax=Spinactinospora alkalitolerans TaxID=687207 RepID=A0A852TTI8_9ACTN|nr:ABC transporter permease subunit [Spinactinospora alkalitolerans]NYE46971.1 alpha-glucoside transport system permease protein [Spinactinospora alkalitolerans]
MPKTGRPRVVTPVATAGAAPRASRSGRLGPPSWLAAVFLLPALLFLGAYMVYPILFSIYRSLWDATGLDFVGLANYAEMFTDPSTFVALRNNVVWVVVAPTAVTVAGLIFAVLTERIRWSTAFKIVVFMPMAISFLASGVIFRLVYEQDPERGLANAVLTTVRDTVAPTASHPDARPRPEAPLTEAEGGGYELDRPVAAGADPVLLPLVGVQADSVGDAVPAAAPQATGDGVSGTVWVDFTRGGEGTPGTIDPTEAGLPGVRVQAVRDGEVAATATTADDGTFALEGLGEGEYTVRLAADNFTEPYNGVNWLGPTLITPAIIGAYLWVWAGFAMVLIAAGLAAIPREALEAARVDGATEWQVFRRVTVPLLSPVLLVVFVTLMIYVLKIFDLVFIIAPGSVQADANVLALEMWRVSFGGGNDQGLGSALAVFLLLLVVPAMIFQIRRFRQENQ